MTNDVKILQNLAYKYAAICNTEENTEKMKLHRAVNDLRQIRPVVLIDELPWNEMNINDELTLQCNDSFLQSIEWFMRTNLYKYKHMPADMILRPYIPIEKVIYDSGIGINVDEETLTTDSENRIVAHKYNDILQTEEDLDKLHNPVLTYDKEETERRYQLVGEILGDILPVKITGISYLNVKPWDDISRYRGVTNLLIDLARRPKFMHKTVEKITELKLSYLEQYEELDLFDNDPYSLHCTPIHTSDLPSKHSEDGKITRKDIWGRGAAQIFASVSREMHAEFDIEYMKETVGQCGLAYYGCCEPLHQKIDIVEKLPNLRKISITPWADVNLAAEAINTKYVLSAKPNPSAVAVPRLDKDHLQAEIKEILDASRKNNCSCDIVLKDISTCKGRPENIFEWEQVVMDMVQNY